MGSISQRTDWNSRWAIVGVVIVIVAFAALIQLVPYGRDHTSPAVQVEPNWDSAQTRALTVQACLDCHSNQMMWVCSPRKDKDQPNFGANYFVLVVVIVSCRLQC